MNSAEKNRVDLGSLFMYDIYNVFNDFLLDHKESRAVVFLCRKHHTELDGLERSAPRTSYILFKSRINWK